MDKEDLFRVGVDHEASTIPESNNSPSEKIAKAIARTGPNESRSRRNSWLPFPPGPMTTGFPGRAHLRASQVAVSQSPSPPHNRTYEIQVKKLYYKLSSRRKSRVSWGKGLPKLKQKDPPAAEHYILRNINFDAKPGELLAIAGPSGAGKSTLLEVLAGRVKPTSPTGCVLINNQVMKMSHFQRVSGYVMQDDALFPHLTVSETLLFSAKLRLPSHMPVAEKMARVEILLDELGLLHVANTRIGNEMVRGVSGGERRRVSIGVDVIHDPAVLILDEPTSGLDSAAAMNIVAMLRSMAESHNRTVILSIHQPSFRILQQVHSVLLLAEGMVVHHGSLELLAARLEIAGHEIPNQVNVLEYAIDAVNSWDADEFSGTLSSKLKRLSLQDFLQHTQQEYIISQVDLERGESIEELETVGSDPECIECVREKERDEISYANTPTGEVFVLAHRFYKNISRTNELFRLRSIQSLIAGIALGTVFLKVGDSQQGLKERLGFLAFTLTFFLSSTTEALPIFLQERQILIQETSRGAYRISSYVISNALIFAPFLFVMAMLYCVPAYWLVGLNPSYKLFLFFCLVMWLVLLMANSFVAFFSAVVPDYIIGNSLIAAWMGAFFLFSGYFISKDKIPKYWLFMHYMSLFKYPFDSLIVNEYENRLEMCFGPRDKNGVCSLTGAQLIQQAGVTSRQKWVDVVVMVCFVISYRVLCYAVVRYRLSRRRR
ncbi:unnamed protein product [Calypogeia fissa]